jgi:type IV pilus assembly protein PilW
MVALAISLVIVLAATAVYLATRESQRTLDESNAAHESGSFALRIIGRELMNAGFYPAVRVESVAVANVLSEYTNLTGQAAYDFGLFGCDGGVFDPVAGTCPAPTAGAPDSLVVGYFTSDAFGASVGQRVDCAGNDVGTVLLNVARLGGVGAGAAPAQPLFVANRYSLQDETFTVEGRNSTTRSLACNGIGAGNATYQNIISGIDDLQITYGVIQDPSLAVSRYFTATEVNGLGVVDIGNGPIGAWGRVAAVRVCVIARTFETPTAIGATSAADLLRYEDCNGAQITQPQADRTLRKTYVQVFGVRNRQNATY